MRAIQTLFVFLLSSVLISSCRSDDNGPDYKFIDQDASGEIDNVDWTYEDGYAEIDDVGGGETEIFIRLTIAQDQQGCDIVGFPEGDMVFFTIPNAVGIYKLKFDLSGNSESRTVTLFKESEFLNIFAGEGAVQILEITETEVRGRLDARSDSESYVNGNFTVSICPD